MASYGVVTANAFDLLSDEAPQQKKKEEIKDKKQVAKTNKNAGRGGEVNSNITGPTKENRGGPSRNNRGGPRGGSGTASTGGRGQTTRRGGRGAPAPREGKRVFDRKSGTGRGREVRKGGYGGAGAAGRWEEEAVVAQETIQAEQTANKDAAATTTEAKVDDVPVEETEEQKALKKEEEEERKKKSFDEWLAEKKAKSVDADNQLNTREVEVDEKQFKASKAYAKEDDVAEYSSLKRENKLKKGKGKAKKKCRLIRRIQCQSG